MYLCICSWTRTARRSAITHSANCFATSSPCTGENSTAATRFATISFDQAISQNLGIMDATAFALCRDQKLPIKVFSILKNGALKRVVMGEDEGTLVHA